ncbi:MAG: hypothetical protein F6K00_21815 [Leptolyngbya sp. SIOISBB]|nr:hypothetical protein [Leptolyngbya sp. SIOISBB]
MAIAIRFFYGKFSYGVVINPVEQLAPKSELRSRFATLMSQGPGKLLIDPQHL